MMKHIQISGRKSRERKRKDKRNAYLAEEEYLVTALVPSETACLANSPGRMSRTLLKNESDGCFLVLEGGVHIRSLDLSR